MDNLGSTTILAVGITIAGIFIGGGIQNGLSHIAAALASVAVAINNFTHTIYNMQQQKNNARD